MSKPYDAIVIGAGHNGLTCACYLAKAGLKTLVLDQYHTVGGMATTEEITLPGFRSDLHAFGYQFANLSPVPQELKLADFGFELIRPEINCSHVFPNNGIISLHRDVETTVANIARYSPRDAETWRRLAGDFVRAKDSIAAWMNSPPESLLHETEQLVRLPHGMDEYRAGLQSCRSWCNESSSPRRCVHLSVDGRVTQASPPTTQVADIWRGYSRLSYKMSVTEWCAVVCTIYHWRCRRIFDRKAVKSVLGRESQEFWSTVGVLLACS